MIKSARHMLAYDQLPADLRRVLTELVFNFNAEHVLVLHLRGYSPEQIRRYLVDFQTRKHRHDVATDGHIMLQK